MDLPTEKPGYLTSEFWVTVVSALGILLKVWGIDFNTEDTQTIAAGIAGFLTAGAVIWRYVASRGQVKAAGLQAKAYALEARLLSKGAK